MQFTGFSLLTGLIVAWGLVTAILVLLLIYRGMIGMHQEDQLFLSSTSHAFEGESREAVTRMGRLRPYVWAGSVASAVLGVAVIGMLVVRTVQRL